VSGVVEGDETAVVRVVVMAEMAVVVLKEVSEGLEDVVGCEEVVWRMSGGCVGRVWRMCRGCVEDVWRMWWDVWRMCGRCVEDVWR